MYYILYIYTTIYLDTLKLYLDVPWHVGPLIIVLFVVACQCSRRCLAAEFYMFLPRRTILVWPNCDVKYEVLGTCWFHCGWQR